MNHIESQNIDKLVDEFDELEMDLYNCKNQILKLKLEIIEKKKILEHLKIENQNLRLSIIPKFKINDRVIIVTSDYFCEHQQNEKYEYCNRPNKTIIINGIIYDYTVYKDYIRYGVYDEDKKYSSHTEDEIYTNFDDMILSQKFQKIKSINESEKVEKLYTVSEFMELEEFPETESRMCDDKYNEDESIETPPEDLEIMTNSFFKNFKNIFKKEI